MELRKQEEIEYFDKGSEIRLKELSDSENKGNIFSLNPVFVSAYKFLYKFLEDKCHGKKILDYGCGDAMHSVWMAGKGGQVSAIDLSKSGLKTAQIMIEKNGAGDRVKLFLMDCENLDFENNSFNIVFDGETFPSLDLDKALSQIHRVLKPNGFLIGVETLGHNSFANLKRKIQKKRTPWARSHILKISDFKKMEKYFSKIDLYFFHLISWIAFPFVNLPAGRFLLRILEAIDKILIFVFPFLKRYCFKIIFICTKK